MDAFTKGGDRNNGGRDGPAEVLGVRGFDLSFLFERGFVVVMVVVGV